MSEVEYGVEAADDLLGEKRAALEEAHGEIVAIEVKKTVLAFRLPTRIEARRYRQTIARGKTENDDEMEKLLAACCVQPGREGFMTFMDRYPMSLTSIGIVFLREAGFDIDVVK